MANDNKNCSPIFVRNKAKIIKKACSDHQSNPGDLARSLSRVSLGLRLPIAISALGTLTLALLLTGATNYLSFAAVAKHREWLVEKAEALGLVAAFLFMLIYALSTAFSLPAGLLLSTVGGFLFGTLWGGTLIVVGATVDATSIFLAARTVLGDVLHGRAGPFLQKFELGVRQNELNYMLVLRLVPLFLFWLVNLAPAFLRVRTGNFIVGTFVGIIPAAFVFASVCTGLGTLLDSGRTPGGSELFQPHVLFPIVGLALLSLIPIVARRIRPPITPIKK